MAAKNNCIKRDVCIFAKESFCKSNSECGHYIMEKGFTSTNTGSRKCPFLFVEHYACNGEFSHWAVIDVETGEEKWAHPASA